MLRRGQVALQPVNVNESLEELLRLTRTDCIGARVSVTKVTTADLPPAMTDRVQLQQVLLNLIVNACDAMRTNPPEDRILTLTTVITEDEVRIGVLDCGVGLPDDVESLVSAVSLHQGRRPGNGPLDLPHAGGLARREVVGGAPGRTRRRLLCRAASGRDRTMITGDFECIVP